LFDGAGHDGAPATGRKQGFGGQGYRQFEAFEWTGQTRSTRIARVAVSWYKNPAKSHHFSHAAQEQTKGKAMTTIRMILAGVLALGLAGCESTQESDPSVPPPAAFDSRPTMPAPVQLSPQPVPADASPSAYAEDPVIMTFDKEPAPIPAPSTASERPPAGTVYTIQRGDTLYGISMRFYGNRRMIEDIMKANPSIKDVNTIYVGQEITLP
jgi:nucleoid-associated protein YgaU